MGSIGCPKTSIRDYHSSLHVSWKSADLTWLFGDVGLGLAVRGPVSSDVVWHSPVQGFKCELHI
jgi:hypothetical protein